MTDNYDDIMLLPHHVSKRHPQMILYNRAAQFAPFAALSGYNEAVAETARYTSAEKEMMEDDRQLLDYRFQVLSRHLESHPAVSITFFQPDRRKAGGSYVTVQGIVRSVRSHERMVIMEDGTAIRIDSIVNLEGDIFPPDSF